MAADNVMSIEQMDDQVHGSYDDAAALFRSRLDALMASSQAVIGGWQTMHGVLLAFLQSRAKESLATTQRLADCGSPQDALEIQLDFARLALQAYADHLNTIGKIASETLSGCLQPPKHEADAAVERPAKHVAA